MADVYFVIDPAELQGDLDAETIGGMLTAISAEPVSVWDYGAAWGAEMLSVRRFAPSTVVLDQGVVTAIVAASSTAEEAAAKPPSAPPTAKAGRAARIASASRAGRGRAASASAAPSPAPEASAGIAMAVEVDYPESVALGTTMLLEISVSADARTEEGIPFVAEIGDKVEVLVSPKTGFAVEGAPDGQLEVTGDAGGPSVTITLKAIAAGVGRITIYAFRDGTALGSLTIGPEVVAAGEQSVLTTTAAGEMQDVRPPNVDLELVIFEEPNPGGGSALRYRLSSHDRSLGLNLKPFGPVVLEAGPGAYFSDIYKQIEQLPVKTEEDRTIATERLHAIGSELFTTLLPPDLQTLLWELQDRIKAVWVQSDEPWVPWELCRLQGKADGRVVEGAFLCEAFEFTRWIPGLARLSALTLHDVGLIVPGDSGLLNAAQEAEMVRGLAGDGRKVSDIPPDYVSVRTALGAGTHDAIHFCGHGRFPDHSNPTKAEIELAGGRPLRPNDISGDVTNLGLAKPLVFLNACQAGRQSRGLTGVGGWASAVLHAGACAFVGTHWEVTDDLALDFAREFYEQIVTGAGVGRAAHAARLAIRDAGDPTWLAYTVFADPDTAIGA